MPPSGFRALVALDTPYLERDGKKYAVNAGMLLGRGQSRQPDGDGVFAFSSAEDCAGGGAGEVINK